jgi:hypothetical protein
VKYSKYLPRQTDTPDHLLALCPGGPSTIRPHSTTRRFSNTCIEIGIYLLLKRRPAFQFFLPPTRAVQLYTDLIVACSRPLAPPTQLTASSIL